MTAGAETDPLRAIGEVRPARVVFPSEAVSVDKEVNWWGLSGERMDRHWNHSTCGTFPAAPSSASARSTTDRGCTRYVACVMTGAVSQGQMSTGDSRAVSIQRRHAC